MPIPGPIETGLAGSQSSAFALKLDASSFVTRCANAEEARTLVPGCIVGDRHGGLTFTDEVAAIFESRSLGGWQEIEAAPGDRWTIILLNY
jgi:hypothetical protein